MKNKALLFAFYIIAHSTGILAQQNNSQIGDPIHAYLNINNISTVFKNTGISDIDILELNSGFKYPKSSGKTAIYESGFI